MNDNPLPPRADEPDYEDLKLEKAKRLQDYKRSLLVVNHLGLLTEKQRNATQQRQYLDELNFLRENIEDFYKLLTEHEFCSIMFFSYDSEVHAFVDNALRDDKTKCPHFPDKMTPIDIQRLSLHIYRAQTTVSGLLEEIKPAHKRWLEYEDRCKRMWKAVSCIDKEWQADSTFQIVVPKDVWVRIRRIAELIAQLEARMDSLNNAQNVLSRLITLFQLTPSTPLSRESTLGAPQEFAGSAGGGEEKTTGRFGSGGKRFGSQR